MLPSWAATNRFSGVIGSLMLKEKLTRPIVESNLLRRVKEADLDLVVTVESLHPETVNSIRARNIDVALWFPDAVSNYGPLWMFDANYSGVFLKDPLVVSRLNSFLDLPIWYLPEACDPTIHFPIDGLEIPSVAVVGSVYPTKARLLERLLAENVPIRIYGGGNLHRLPDPLRKVHSGEYLRARDKATVYRNSIAVLNTLHPAELESVNCRLFEATACGGAVLAESRASLHGFFDVDSQIVEIRSFENLVEEIFDLSTNPHRRRDLGNAASHEALARHTYKHRLAELLEKINH